MNRNFPIISGLLLSSALSGLASAPKTDRSALDVLGKQVSSESLKQVVQVKGFNGQDQPREWRVVLFQPREAGKFRLYRVRDGKVVDNEQLTDETAAELPGGVVPYDKVRVNSAQVFRIADREAKEAKVGFDSISYELRCRELSQDPVWYVDLRDHRNLAVGRLYVSALDGDLLGKVWYPQSQETSPASAPDSAASDGQPLSISDTAPKAGEPQEKEFSPLASVRRGLGQVSGKVFGAFSRDRPADVVE